MVEVILLYAGIGSAVVILGMFFYLRSDFSKKQYRCPHCGERITVELMEAKHCSSCGADLNRED